MAIKQESAASLALKSYLDDLTETLPSANYSDSALISTKVASIDSKITTAERLLNKAQLLDTIVEAAPENNPLPVEQNIGNELLDTNNAQQDKEISEIADITYKQEIRSLDVSLQESLPAHFQVLLCEVSGVTIAIPLIELGGIHKIDKLSMVAKKASWFKGVLIKGNDKYNCIDAATWLVPEKYSKAKQANNAGEHAQQDEYKFAVQLGKSPYALCCNSISHTIELTTGDVKWRANTKTHPWLAGLLKEKMCALIDGAKMVQEVLK